jgi:outer membrane protein insertion porin family
MIINKIAYYVCLTFLFLSLFPLTPTHAQELKKISILPFEVYSKEDSAAIKESLYKKLSEELKKEKRIQLIPADLFLESKEKVDERRAISAGKSLHADFVVMGSLTKLGETLSVDAKIIDIGTGNILSPVSVQGKGLANLGAIAAQLKTEILVRTGLIEKIAKIEIKGNRKIEASAIIQQIKSKEGNPFFEEDITADIKTIFKMGFFLDVSAGATSTPQGKIVTFTVLEKGLITDIQIKGNKALSKDDIQEVMTIKTRQSLNQEKIKTDIEKIKTLYDSKCYYNA